MKEKKIFIIWAGNLEFNLIKRVESFLKKQYPVSNIYVRNADVYSGPKDLEKCDGMFIQSGYQRIIDNAETAGVKLINFGGEHEIEGTVSGRREGNAASEDELPDTPKTGSENSHAGGVSSIQIDPVDNGMADKTGVSEPRRRGRPRKQAASGTQE